MNEIIFMLGDWPVMTALGLAMAGWLLLRRSWRAGLAVLAAILAARGLWGLSWRRKARQ